MQDTERTIHGEDALDNPDVHHEYSDVNVRGVLAFAAGLALLCIVAALVIWLMFEYFDARERRADRPVPELSATATRLPPAPRLQAYTAPAVSEGFAPDPRRDLEGFQRAMDELLTTYGWVDQAEGIVRIPVSRAMELILERGIQPPPAAGPAAGEEPAGQAPAGRPPAGAPADRPSTDTTPPGDQP